jgi:propanol-preferring alcohol dehydrogenase
MRAAELRSPGVAATSPLSMVERAPEEPTGTGVLLKVAACALCRTDLQLCEGDLEMHKTPVVPGHQIVGKIVATGPDATSPVGTRVGVTWLAGACGQCEYCTSGYENLCHEATFTGWDRDGGFAEYAVADDRFVIPLPDGLAATDAAPLLCGGVIGMRALRLTGLHEGQRLGLYGFGGSAGIVIQLATHMGLEVFVATRSESERTRASSLGATWTGGYDELPPEPLHSAITFAPVGSVVVAALRAVARGGSVVINAIHLDEIPAFDYDLLWHERSLRSVANVTRSDAVELLRLASAIPLVTRHDDYPLDQANSALADLANGAVSGAAVLVP